jgi:MbtH protein
MQHQDGDDDTTIYTVVMNSEEQYSVWPAWKPIPAGWRAAGKTGEKQECLDWIKEVWTDMRPLSVRRALENTGE